MESLISVHELSKAYRIWDDPASRILAPVFRSLAGIALSQRAKAQLLNRAAARYRDFWALRDISFTIRKGESVGIVGRNGSGKSTLLQIIAGTMQATSGAVQVNGRIAALLELGSGFNPEFTGRENLFLSAALQGFTRQQTLELYDDICAFAEIGDFIDQPVKTYSSGMQLRLAFAVSTASRPDLLIVDEALSVGDAYFQARCHERIALYKKQGMTLLLVTHATEDMVRQCDRALFLRNGHLEKDGDPREVSNLYLDDLFGGRASRSSSDPLVKGSRMVETAQDLYHTRPGFRKEEHRWGNGGARILDYSIISGETEYPNQLEAGSSADFYFKVHFQRAFASVVPGFLVKTLEGIILYGTNSIHASRGREHMAVNSDEIVVFKFTLPISLNSGHYLISFGISEGGSLEQLVPLDRRYDSVLIAVTRQTPFWGITDLHANFEVVARK